VKLTEQVKARARELGADLVGIAPVERFAGAPLRMSPQGLLPGAKCVIVAGIHHLDAAVELAGDPTPQDAGPYDTQCTAMNPKLDDVSFLVAGFLEAKGHRALPITASNIWRYHPYKDLDVSFAPDLAHRYAAVAAGLGQIGWSGLTLTPDFGPRVRYVSVVTDADLEPSSMYEGEDLCDRCMQCVKHCPTDAFRKEVRRINELNIGGKVFRFPETNKWRCAWAENFALDLAHVIPEKVDEPTILRYLEKYGMRGGEVGCCLQFCMIPQRRYHDTSYCRPPRRRKEPGKTRPAGLLSEVRRILRDTGADIAAVGRRQDFDGMEMIRPESHLPDAASLVSIGIRIPAECAKNDGYLSVLRRRLDYAAFDVAHHLDLAGYSAVTCTRIPDEPVADVLGTYETDILFETVLTSAPLPSLRWKRGRTRRLLTAEGIRDFCRGAGADLVGFFTAERYAGFRRALRKTVPPPKVAEVVEDAGYIYGPFVPRTRTQSADTRPLSDWLEGARSVVVLGMHLPDTAVETAKTTPAETVGPFAFARYEAQLLLGDIAFKLIRRLNDSGRRATLAYDLSGLASRVHSSRGMLPDMRANGYAALLSGLAFIGIHGSPITHEHGVRQVFVSVVTDCVLPNDALYHGVIECERCKKPCIPACPTSALKNDPVPLRLEGRTFHLPRYDSFACDWAKRYCLAAEDGPRYCGLEVDVPVAEERSARAVARTVSKVNWGVQKRHANIVEECIRVCLAKGRKPPHPHP
jgi:epoxyqueuosine reductase QueG